MTSINVAYLCAAAGFLVSLAGIQYLQIRRFPENSPAKLSNVPRILDDFENFDSSALFSRPRMVLPIGEDELSKMVDRFKIDQRCPLSGLLHAGMLFGWEMKLPDEDNLLNSRSLRELVADSDLAIDYFGAPVFAETRYGLMCETAKDPSENLRERQKQAHDGQLLCEIAKQGLSLESTLGDRQVGSLLRHAQASYVPHTQTSEWTCIALMLYAPKSKQWTNKFGAIIDFDLMALSLVDSVGVTSGRACYGLHVHEALSVMSAIESKHGLLKPATRERVDACLRTELAIQVSRQNRDGSWDLQGSEQPGLDGLQSGVRVIEKVHMTSHQLSWMAMLSPNAQPPRHVFRSGIIFLIKAINDVDAETLKNNYCPYSHAMHIIQLLGSK